MDRWTDGPEPQRTAADPWVDLVCALLVGAYTLFWLDVLARHYGVAQWMPLAVGLVAASLVKILQPVSPAAAPAST